MLALDFLTPANDEVEVLQNKLVHTMHSIISQWDCYLESFVVFFMLLKPFSYCLCNGADALFYWIETNKHAFIQNSK